MPLTLRLSTAIAWFSHISFVVSLLLKSLRLSEIFAWTFATFNFALFFEPLTFLLNCRCRFVNSISYFLKFCSEPDLNSSEVTQTSLIPTSIPIVFSILGSSKTCSSTANETKYLSAQSFEIVMDEGSPLKLLDHRISKGSLFFAIVNFPFENEKAVFTKRIDCSEFFFLN